MTILTPQEAADFLRMSIGQLYTLTRARSKARMKDPIPVIRVNSNLRFSKESLTAWLQRLETEQ